MARRRLPDRHIGIIEVLHKHFRMGHAEIVNFLNARYNVGKPAGEQYTRRQVALLLKRYDLTYKKRGGAHNTKLGPMDDWMLKQIVLTNPAVTKRDLPALYQQYCADLEQPVATLNPNPVETRPERRSIPGGKEQACPQ